MNRKGFTIIELAIVMSVILVIVGISSGVYMGISAKADEAGVTKTMTVDLPAAIQSYQYDMGEPPDDCYRSTRTSTNGANSLKVLSNLDLIVGVYPQSRWKGPYLPVGVAFDANGNVRDKNIKSASYCYKKEETATQIFHMIQITGVPAEDRDKVMKYIKLDHPENFLAEYNTGNDSGTYNYVYQMHYKR